jgi:hypothetical protein
MQDGVKAWQMCASSSSEDILISSITWLTLQPTNLSLFLFSTLLESANIPTFDPRAAETMKAVKDIVGFVRR